MTKIKILKNKIFEKKFLKENIEKSGIVKK